MDFRRKLSSGGDSFSEGTSRFFSSMMAKKNGLMNDLTNKIESVGAMMKSSPSGSSLGDSDSSPARYSDEEYTSETKTTPPMSEEKAMVNKENSEEKLVSKTNDSRNSLGERSQMKRHGSGSSSNGSINEEKFVKSGVNMSFDEPIYSPTKVATPEKRSSSVGPGPRAKDRATPPTIPPPPYNPNRTGRRSSRSSTNSPRISSGHSSDSERYVHSERNTGEERTRAPSLATTKRRSSTVDEMLFDDYQAELEPEVQAEDDNVFNKRKTLLPMGDLISFDEPELEDFHPKPIVNRRNLKSSEDNEKSGEKYPSVSSVESSEVDIHESSLNNQTSVESSEPEYEDEHKRRLDSIGSERSWSSNYSLDSQPDDLTLECMSFMKLFVGKIFKTNEDISQMEKSKFGEYCQQVPGRQWFARYVNSQRVVSKKVEESIFFRLVQYFAVVLFECNEAEDFVPAKSLMNMCFTFYHETRHSKKRYKNFLYSYLREQPIWQSLRFWNAAFFDAVQNERARKPVCTSDDGLDTQTDDSMFQENITFGQLGTFTCNMRAFGLSKELCLEFLRKQSTIADLKPDQIRMLKDNVEKWKDH